MSEPNPAVTFAATLVDEWVRCGLTHAVVSPGSRSTPLAVALAEAAADGRVALEVVLDERSASFTALGIGLATGRPAALVCTSGTAATEYHSAVVEAHQADVPMLVLTADRPPELVGVGAPQTIEQRELYGRAVRWYCEPGPPVAAGAGTWRSLARDAWIRSIAGRPGPVHLNLAFREPLVGPSGPLPPVDEVPVPPPAPLRPEVPDEVLARLLGAVRNRRGLIVAGVRAAADPEEAAAVIALAARLGWPVLADAPSGCRVPDPVVVTTADPVLRVPDAAAALAPEIVLRFGGLHASRVLNEWLAGCGAVQVGVDRGGDIPDPDRLLAERIPVAPAHLCRRLAGLLGDGDPTGGDGRAPEGWAAAWAAVEGRARAAIDAELAAGGAGEIAVAAAVLAALPDGAALVVSSSMPVRDLEWYAPARAGVRVFANRGANGIDGVMSTARGVARSGVPTTLLIGDLAFLHDAGAMLGGLRGLRVVVVDNDGGGIFSFLPQHSALPEERFELLFGTPQGVDLVVLATAYGVPARRVAPADLPGALTGAVGDAGEVLVVPSDRATNLTAHRRVNASVAAALG